MREKRDPLDAVLKGLSIATQVYGLKKASDDSDIAEEQRLEKQGEKMAALSEKQDKERGVMTPMQRVAMQKDFEEVASGTQGAVPAFVRDQASGQETPLFLKARGKEAKAPGTRLVETIDPTTGKPTQMIVEDKAGASYAVPPKAAPAAKDISVAERNTLQSQYDRDLGTRKNRMVLEAYDDAMRLVQNPSPASDQALVFAYMKSLDPNSVVRESEAESAQALGGMMEQAKSWYAKQAGEAGLTPGQRQDLLAQIRKLAGAASTRQDGVDKQFTDVAGRRNVDTRDLRFIGRPQIEEDKAPGGAPPAGGSVAATPPGPPPPKVGDEVDGYVFKGGDPKDKGSWVQRTSKPSSVGNAASILERK